MESVTLGVKLWYLGVEISREIIGVAIGVGGIGNFGGEITLLILFSRGKNPFRLKPIWGKTWSGG